LTFWNYGLIFYHPPRYRGGVHCQKNSPMESSIHFNAFDLLLLITLAFSMIIGMTRGFIREFLGLSAWAGAGLIALKEYDWPKVFFSGWIREPLIVKIASHFIVFFCALLVFLVIAQLISHYVSHSLAQSVDRSLGIVFGFVRGLVIICGVYTASLFFILPSDQPAVVKSSRSYSWLVESFLIANHFIPPSFHRSLFDNSLKEIRSQRETSQDLTKKLSSPTPSKD